jgi:hypothetical protein
VVQAMMLSPVQVAEISLIMVLKITELPDTPVLSWSIVNLVPVPSAAAVTPMPLPDNI